MASAKSPLSYLDFVNNVHSAEASVIASKNIKHILSKTSLTSGNAFQHATYLLDFTQKRYENVTGNCHPIYGYRSDYFKDGGLDSYIDKWDKTESEIYCKQIFPDFLKVLKKIPTDKIQHIICSRNYLFTTQGGAVKNLLQRSIYIMESKSNLPVATLGTVSDITNFTGSEGITHTIEYLNPSLNEADTQLLFKKTYFKDSRFTEISKRELEVLKWMADGLSSKQVADRMNLSIYTINNHRKSMLHKMNSKNSVELINYALHLKLF